MPQKNAHYTIGNHEAMATDKVRVDSYASAISRAVGGKRVLDVGCGPFLLLSRICLSAGATSVVSVEGSSKSVVLAGDILNLEYLRGNPVRLREHEENRRSSGRRYDRDLDRELSHCLRLLDRLHLRLDVNHLNLRGRKWRSANDKVISASVSAQSQLTAQQDPRDRSSGGFHSSGFPGTITKMAALDMYEGLSSEVALPSGIEVVVHEILGHVASSEGVVAAIRDIRSRHHVTTPGCVYIPRAAGTFLAPTWAFSPSLVERLLQYAAHGTMHQPEGMYHVNGFPPDRLIAPAQAMEWWDFCGDLRPEQRRVCSFHVDGPGGYFEGLHLHMRAELDEVSCINTYTSPTTWSCTWIRLFAPCRGVWVNHGSRIECICDVDVSSHRPVYRIDVGVADCGSADTKQVATYSWSGDG